MTMAQFFLRQRLGQSSSTNHDNTLSVVSISEEDEEMLEFVTPKSSLSAGSRSGAKAPDIPSSLSKNRDDDSPTSTLNQFSSAVLTQTSSKMSKGMQTSVSESSSSHTSLSKDSLNTTKAKNKSIFVCYPNYSLPDLTFLGQSSKKFNAKVYLCPQKVSGSPDQSQVDTETLPEPVNKNNPTIMTKGVRTLSTDDLLKIQESSLSHVKGKKRNQALDHTYCTINM
jgi:hypothetical protein